VVEIFDIDAVEVGIAAKDVIDKGKRAAFMSAFSNSKSISSVWKVSMVLGCCGVVVLWYKKLQYHDTTILQHYNLKKISTVLPSSAIGELAHEEDTSAAEFENIFGSRGIREFVGVKSRSFVADEESDILGADVFDTDDDLFVFILLVTMHDSICNGFSE